jgi:hypothetical protein
VIARYGATPRGRFYYEIRRSDRNATLRAASDRDPPPESCGFLDGPVSIGRRKPRPSLFLRNSVAYKGNSRPVVGIPDRGLEGSNLFFCAFPEMSNAWELDPSPTAAFISLR